MVVECFVEIESIGKYWKKTRTYSGYHEILKRKAGVLETQTVALATSSGELSPVLLVSPVKPIERPGNERAPLRVPDMKHMKILGPKHEMLARDAMLYYIVLEYSMYSI